MSHLNTAYALGEKQAEAYFTKEGYGKLLGGLAKR